MPLHSMTAFARESLSEPASIQIELRSVNHRYLDCHFKLSDSVKSLEPWFRELLSKNLKRGKVDCQIRISNEDRDSALVLNEARLTLVLDATQQIVAASPDVSPPNALDLLQFPGVFEGSENSESLIQSAVKQLFERALKSLVENRQREGSQLSEFLTQRLDKLAAELTVVRKNLPELRCRQEERIRSRLAELSVEIDEGRLEQELALLLQKSDVDEELDRLDAHINEITLTLGKGGPCGRRLDFLMQELNREANTLASKSIASSTTQTAVELKVLIEQMREQIQNLE
ncbi:MAG: YicC/YloC family endoribonuclease [Pseudomonadota bacterium]